MLRVVTINVNGIRASANKGLFTWVKHQRPDVICMQEVKAHQHQLADPVFYPPGYHYYYFTAEKKGYSSVAIYTRAQPDRIINGLGWSCADDEGRYIQVDFGKLSIASIYLPSGSSGDERQALKYEFMQHYEKRLRQQRRETREYIICGDWNIVHKQIDIKNWTSNQKTSGCLPEERAWLDKVFTKIGYVDAFRELNQEPHQYTWWSNRGRAWDKNVGWRIDYQVVTPKLRSKIKAVNIYRDERFSDHAPLTVDYDLKF